MVKHRTSIRRAGAVLLATLAAVAGIAATLVAQGGGQVLLSDAFSGTSSDASVLTLNVNAPALPCLTAGPAGSDPTSVQNCGLASPDPAGQGTLRLTSTDEQHASAVVFATSVPTTQGLRITFKQYQYGGYGLDGPGSAGGGDGISVFLAAAPPHPQTLGPQGGALGYAADGGSPGLPGGWLGVGLDAFGNYSNPDFGGAGCTDPLWAGIVPDAITVRGPGFGTAGYCLISSTAAGTPLATSLRAATRAASMQSVQIIIDPLLGEYRVNIDPAGGTNYQPATSGPLPAYYYDPTTGALTAGIPPRITFGFGASTGSATDVHEISDVVVTTLNGSVPVLGLTKSHDGAAQPTPGSSFNFLITAQVTGTQAETAPTTVRVTDTMPAGLTITGAIFGNSWNCAASTSTALDCRYLGTTAIPGGTMLPTLSVPVTLSGSATPGTTIVNTARVISSDAAQPVDADDVLVVGTATQPLTITTTSLPRGTLGVAYSAQFAATGGSAPYGWTLDNGALPAGLTLSAAGVIAGVPTADGTFSMRVRVTDAAGATAARGFNIIIEPPAVVVTTTQLPPGEVGLRYTASLAAGGGTPPFTWTIAAGVLPSGLSLSARGVISGTPLAAGNTAFTVRVTDAKARTDGQRLTISILPAVTITTASLPGGRVGNAYSATLARSGGLAPFTWSLASGSLPAGLTLSNAGVISGTPTTAGTSNFTVRVRDALNVAATRALSIVVVNRLEKAYIPERQAWTSLGITIVNVNTGALVKRLAVTRADGTVASPDGRRVYYWPSIGIPATIGLIDTRTDTVLRTRDIGLSSTAYTFIQDVKVSADNSRVYVVAQTGNGTAYFGSIFVLNASTLATIRQYSLPQTAEKIALSPDGSTAYISTIEPGSVYKLHSMSTSTGAIIASRTVPFYAYSMLTNPAGSRLVVSSAYPVSGAAGRYAIFQYSVPDLVETLRTDVPSALFWIDAADNSFVYGVGRFPDSVTAVELATGAVRSAPVGSYPADIAINASGLNGFTLTQGAGTAALVRFRLSSLTPATVFALPQNTTVGTGGLAVAAVGP